MMAEAETLDSTDTPHFRRHFFHKELYRISPQQLAKQLVDK